MKINSFLRLFLTGILCVCLFSLIIVCSRTGVSIKAQQQCPPVPNLGWPTWEQGQSVTVVFDSHWSDAEIAAAKRAFENWNAANGQTGNNSGVTFVGFQRGSQPDYTAATNTVYVKKADGWGNPGTNYSTNQNSNGHAGVDTITFDTSRNLIPDWDPDGMGLTATMAHEIGHTFGLGDCYLCSNTVMCSGCGTYGPTNCDNQQVKAIDYNLDLGGCPGTYTCGSGYGWNPNSCSCEWIGDSWGGGGGGGYCTPYYWVWFQSWDGGETWEVIEIEYAGCW